MTKMYVKLLYQPTYVLWQTVKTLMKCRMRRHFLRVCTVCLGKIDFFFQIIT